MRIINFILIIATLIMLSSCSIKVNKTNEQVGLSDKLIGYWISTNENYEKSKDGTVVFYGNIDDNKSGVYLQGDKEMTYRILQIDEPRRKVKIAIKFTNTRERTEIITFSNDYNRILNKIVTPDGYSIVTYYIRKD